MGARGWELGGEGSGSTLSRVAWKSDPACTLPKGPLTRFTRIDDVGTGPDRICPCGVAPPPMWKGAPRRKASKKAAPVSVGRGRSERAPNRTSERHVDSSLAGSSDSARMSRHRSRLGRVGCG